mmetsp:Transcript_11602/g.22831  ORF Transcript_11602/g.22831 Transcript_11602/m.22831 type:complete len:388 (+) Transcript_11602:206-1369(+)
MSLEQFWSGKKRRRDDRGNCSAVEDQKRREASRVPCPVCGLLMTITKIDAHLESRCGEGAEPTPRSAAENDFTRRFRREGAEELVSVKNTGSRKSDPVTLQNLESMGCPFEIVPNAVEPDLADDLAKMLMREAKASWKPSVWTVFNNTGGTNRLSATYRFGDQVAEREQDRPGSMQENANRDADPSYVTPETSMKRLRDSKIAMQEMVRKRFEERLARKLTQIQHGDKMYVEKWEPSFVLCNYYRDGTDGIAFHSDYLTALGPRAIVAALSLGSTRLFRWFKIDADTKQIFTAKLPHNHAVIMWPGAQEEWKHGVPTQANDTIGVHPLTQLARVSLTFRMRRPEVAENAPKCNCGRPAALKYSTKLKRYFYKCNPNTTQTCDFFGNF